MLLKKHMRGASRSRGVLSEPRHSGLAALHPETRNTSHRFTTTIIKQFPWGYSHLDAFPGLRKFLILVINIILAIYIYMYMCK